MPKLMSSLQRCDSAEISVTKNKNLKKKRSVSFCEIVSIRATTHIKNMTSDEIKSAWYTTRETNKFKKQIWSEAKRMTNGVPAAASTTRRGLEYRTPEGSAKRKNNKLKSIHAVLDEQDNQHMINIRDPDTLRKIYLQHSRHCRLEARQLGAQDALDAQELVPEEEQARRSAGKKEVFLRIFSKKTDLADEVKQRTEIVWAI